MAQQAAAILRVLTLDVGSRHTGTCVGSLHAKTGALISWELRTIELEKSWASYVTSIVSLLASDKWDFVILEDYGFGSGRFFNTDVAEIVGVMKFKLATEKYARKLLPIAPNTVKFLFTGKGKATKSMMKKTAGAYIGKKVQSDHEADALALLISFVKICGMNAQRNLDRKGKEYLERIAARVVEL